MLREGYFSCLSKLRWRICACIRRLVWEHDRRNISASQTLDEGGYLYDATFTYPVRQSTSDDIWPPLDNDQSTKSHQGPLILSLKAASPTRCSPLASKFPGSSHFSNASFATGQSSSIIANHAVSRLRPLTTICLRNTPSNSNPSRRAARFDGSFKSLAFHSYRRYPSSSNTCLAIKNIASVAARVRCSSGENITKPTSMTRCAGRML